MQAGADSEAGGRRGEPPPKVQAVRRGVAARREGRRGAVSSGASRAPREQGEVPLREEAGTVGDSAGDWEFPEGFRSLAMVGQGLKECGKGRWPGVLGACGGRVNRDKGHNEMGSRVKLKFLPPVET